MEQLDSHWTDFDEIWYLSIFRKSAEKIQVALKSDKIGGASYAIQYTFLIMSRSVLLRTRNVSDKSCRRNQNTHFVFSSVFFFENRAVYEIIWKNITEPGRPQMRIPKATNTYSVYVILIAFPLQQWLHERVSVLRRNALSCFFNSCLLLMTLEICGEHQIWFTLQVTC